MNTQMKTRRGRKLTGLVATMIAAACMSTTSTAATDSHYTMAAISDAAHGRKVLSGDYEGAIDKIRMSDSSSVRNFYSANNLCVAYVQLRDTANASKACDTAVSGIQTMLAKKRENSYSYAVYERFLAIALSNRGVLRAISGDEELAYEDFSDALRLKASISAPETNLARLSEATPPKS